MVLVSFIVPIYNTPGTKVSRCIDSILRISASEFECIVVDDGSSIQNSEEYRHICGNDSRLRYCRKENGGVSSARNLGIEMAVGEYLYFVDSDDELIPDAMNEVLSFVKSQMQYDIVFTNMELLENGKTSAFIPYTGCFEIQCKDVLGSMTKDGKMNGPVAKLIRRETLIQNGIRFDETMINAEDAVFQLEIMKFVPRMYYTDVYTYRYHRFSETGISRTLRFPETILDNQLFLHDKFCEIIQSEQIAKEDQDMLKLQQEELFVRNLFRWVLELSDAGLMNDLLEARKQESIAHFQQQRRCKLSRSGQISLWSMRMDSGLLIRCLALLRRYYLKFKAM